MRFAIALAGTCLISMSSCRKWLSADPEQPQKQTLTPARESPALGKGKVRITVRNIKSEKQAWFQNCLSFEASGQSPAYVGCNKRKPGVTFLEAETSNDFEVTKGENVSLKFTFETWLSSSSCITYDACKDPYPNTPARRSIGEKSKSVLCYKAGPGKYRLFYEDQPDDHHFLDYDIRSKLVLKGTSAPAPQFDPAHPTDDLKYAKKTGAIFSTKDPIQACVLNKAESDGSIPESTLQACIGIDWRDLVVDVEAADNAISIEGLSESNCRAL